MAKTLLIVDDDDLLRRSLAHNLTRANFQVKTAASAEAALELVSADPPDLILMDIGLPGVDGLETLRLLRQQIPLIFVTARSRPFDEALGLELGADDYIRVRGSAGPCARSSAPDRASDATAGASWATCRR